MKKCEGWDFNKFNASVVASFGLNDEEWFEGSTDELAVAFEELTVVGSKGWDVWINLLKSIRIGEWVMNNRHSNKNNKG